MDEEELPKKVERIIEALSEVENMMDEEFQVDDLFSVMPPWHLFADYPYYTLGRVFDKLEEGDSINVIPSIYGRRGGVQRCIACGNRTTIHDILR